MKAARIHRYGGPEVITIEDIAMADPARGQVRVRIAASSINPVDYKIRQGGYLPDDKLPMTLGRDFSGVVEAVGEGVTAFQPGEAVMAMLPMETGGNAEYAVCPAEICARKPQKAEHDDAAALGLAALTAWQGLFDHGGLRAGQRVLIHGAAGGVGHLAVQFAAARGAEVFATCGGDDMPFVLGLGALEAIDYKAERFEDRVHDADLVFDLVNGETQDRSWVVLKRGGALISTLREPDQAQASARGVKALRYMAQPDGAQLGEIGELVEAGKVVPAIARVMTLDEVAAAHTLLEQGHLRGKLIIRVDDKEWL